MEGNYKTIQGQKYLTYDIQTQLMNIYCQLTPKFSYKFDVIPIKIPVEFFMKFGEIILKSWCMSKCSGLGRTV